MMEKPSEKPTWSIIKFPNENDAVAAVPTSWLRGNCCYWPPWSEDRIQNAIKNCKPPDVDTWQMHSFIPMRNNVFEDFQSVKRKIETALERSDLDSHCESQKDEAAVSRNSKGRKLVKTAITRYTSFELSEEDSREACSLPEPPKFRGSIKKKNEAKPVSNTEEIMDEVAVRKKIVNANKRDKDSTDSDKFKGAMKKRTGQVLRTVNENIYNVNEVQNINQEIVQVIGEQDGAPPLDSQQIFDFLKKIVRKQNVIQSMISDMAEDILEIKSKMGQGISNSEDVNDSIFQILNLPVDSEEDLRKFEDYLKNETSMNTAIKEIASSGGKTVYELVYRATQKLITNKFAANYSYFGRQKKLKFLSLKLNELLKRVAMKIFQTSEKEAEIAIAKWLRRCAERAKKE